MSMVLTLALACGGEGTTDAETGSDDSMGDASGDAPTTSPTTTPSTSPTTGTGDPEHPSGQSCPLVGFFVECDGGGRTYCDEIAGVLRFGPCIDEAVCDISGSPSCDRHCELVDGVPTWVPDEDNCGETG